MRMRNQPWPWQMRRFPYWLFPESLFCSVCWGMSRYSGGEHTPLANRRESFRSAVECARLARERMRNAGRLKGDQ
jgi:hypothetical protein